MIIYLDAYYLDIIATTAPHILWRKRENVLTVFAFSSCSFWNSKPSLYVCSMLILGNFSKKILSLHTMCMIDPIPQNASWQNLVDIIHVHIFTDLPYKFTIIQWTLVLKFEHSNWPSTREGDLLCIFLNSMENFVFFQYLGYLPSFPVSVSSKNIRS